MTSKEKPNILLTFWEKYLSGATGMCGKTGFTERI